MKRGTLRSGIFALMSAALAATGCSGGGGGAVLTPVPATYPIDFHFPTTISEGAEVPRDLALADFDGDGALDLVYTLYATHKYGLRLGTGGGTFGAETTAVLGAGYNPYSVITADFNQDGKADFATTSFGGAKLSVLLGNGDGTFQAQTDLVPAVGTGSVAVAADFNGDAWPDLAWLSYWGGANSVSVFLNDGTGAFAAPVSFNGGTTLLGMAAADFNADGKMDLAVSAHGTHQLRVFPGNGDGTFAAASSTLTTGTAPTGVVATDFNGDGKADLAVSHYTSTFASVFLGDGAGGFGARADLSGTNTVYELAAADLNGDGFKELVVPDSDSGTLVFNVFQNNTYGGFSSAHPFTTGNGARGIAIGDLNGDGRPDVVTADYIAKTLSVVLHK